MNDKLSEAIGVMKDYRKGDFVDDDKFCEAIDTVVKELEKPLPSDEKIEQYALENILEDDSMEAIVNMKVWIEGAIWMRDLIKKLGK